RYDLKSIEYKVQMVYSSPFLVDGIVLARALFDKREPISQIGQKDVAMGFLQGFVCSDTMLAGALWRNLYTEKMVDLINLNRAVRYVRANVSDRHLLNAWRCAFDGSKH